MDITRAALLLLEKYMLYQVMKEAVQEDYMPVLMVRTGKLTKSLDQAERTLSRTTKGWIQEVGGSIIGWKGYNV